MIEFFHTVVELDYPSTDNMKRDLELLTVSNILNTPILRIYSWNEPTISIGKLQQANDFLDIEKIRADNILIIQRPTGGRAVFHKDDINYSFMIPKSQQHHFGSAITETYNHIASALHQSLSLLHIECSLSNREISRNEIRATHKLPCFLSPNKNEIMVQQKKLIGSAQLRTSQGVLQHGSIPLNESTTHLPYYEMRPMEERVKMVKLLQKATISIQVCNEEISREEIVQALIDGFAKAFSSSYSFLPKEKDCGTIKS